MLNNELDKIWKEAIVGLNLREIAALLFVWKEWGI
jgi:hypothetical protein